MMHALAVALVPLLAQSKAGVAAEAPLEIRATPIVDLYFYVRWLSTEGKPALPDVVGLKDAVDSAAALQQELGSTLAFGPLEGLLGDCSSAKDLRAAFEHAPEKIELRSGTSAELRRGALRLSAALEKSEPALMAEIWPEHQSEILHAQDEIAAAFRAKEAECLAYVEKHLALAQPDQPIRVRLVDRAPAPGAITQRDDQDRGVSFVAVHAVEGTQLFETILHEATHTLDLATKHGSVLDDLRARLEKAGYTRRDREWRDVPHTLMFVQAGETIRRIVDPKHEHYGTVAGYYAKVKSVADIERPLWTSYLDGKLERDAALEKIVAAVVSASPPH